ncbi:MAG: hypothetical protein AMXMBFR13_14050 [Phycisphaerae bacterium]
MKVPENGHCLRVFIGESDRWQGRALYEAIVLKARELHLAGATVIRGLAGYGAHSRLHTARVLRLSEDLPLIVEIVDSRDKLELLLPFLDEAVKEGLVTIEPVEVIWYRMRSTEPPAEIQSTPVIH